MRSAIWYGGETLRVEEQPDPPLAPEEVRVQVAASAVCGTDVHALEGKFPLFVPPRVLGHEFAGTVVEVGSQVTRLKAGDRVAAEPGVVCNECWYCRNGQENLCLNRRLSPGAFASHIVLPSRLLWKLPDEMPFEVAALAEPVSCAVHAIDLGRIQSGSSVAIVGAGGIGTSLLQISRRSGAAITIVTELDPKRRALAKQLGADVVVDPSTEDPVEAVQKATGGLGADVVFEAVGLPATVEQAIQLAGKGARIILVGVNPPGAKVSVEPFELFNKELTITATYMRPYTFGRALRWLQTLDMDPIIGPKYDLSHTLDAIHALRDKVGVKPLVTPQV